MPKFTDAVVTTLQGHFNIGDQPTEAQFAELITRIQEGIELHDHDGTGDGDGIASLGPLDSLEVADGAWVGLGVAIARIEFNNLGIDTIILHDAYVGIACTPGTRLTLVGDSVVSVATPGDDGFLVLTGSDALDHNLAAGIRLNGVSEAASPGDAEIWSANVTGEVRLITGNFVDRLVVAQGGAVKITDLAGVGARAVIAAADGTLSAP